MNLPFSDNLPTNKLASSFATTSATYKFYWLIAIIELVENGQTNLKKKYNQEQLAEIMKVSRTTISKIESRKFNCSIEYLSKFF